MPESQHKSSETRELVSTSTSMCEAYDVEIEVVGQPFELFGKLWSGKQLFATKDLSRHVCEGNKLILTLPELSPVEINLYALGYVTKYAAETLKFLFLAYLSQEHYDVDSRVKVNIRKYKIEQISKIQRVMSTT